MLFNSLHFLLFLPVVLAVYFVIPTSWRRYWLLVASYYFYLSWRPAYGLLLLTSTLTTFAAGRALQRLHDQPSRPHRFSAKHILWLSIGLNLGLLAFFKYANFALDNLSSVLNFFHLNFDSPTLNILLPVGISFYTFQSIGYVIDVYRHQVTAEKSLIDYALFVSFFPQLVAGPIERTADLLPQIKNVHTFALWNWARVRAGFLLMIWGFFEKLVIADRAAIFVRHALEVYPQAGARELIVMLFLFAWQIYTDFNGYCHIAQGVAQMMGFTLHDNFRQPYFARDGHDFWRRWHISLTKWFTDYVYIPLGGSRVNRARHYTNIMIVFLLSGLWHGASWHFVIWGGINGLWQIASDIKKRLLVHWHLTLGDGWSTRMRQRLTTFAIAGASWSFFVMPTLTSVGQLWQRLLSSWRGLPLKETFGLRGADFICLALALAALVAVDLAHERGIQISSWLTHQEWWCRYTIYTLLILSVVLLGVYGPEYDASKFIYFDF
ncbi:MBOAT family protein [bacterium]|nr:MBOAT family protein [bacterium]